MLGGQLSPIAKSYGIERAAVTLRQQNGLLSLA